MFLLMYNLFWPKTSPGLLTKMRRVQGWVAVCVHPQGPLDPVLVCLSWNQAQNNFMTHKHLYGLDREHCSHNIRIFHLKLHTFITERLGQ